MESSIVFNKVAAAASPPHSLPLSPKPSRPVEYFGNPSSAIGGISFQVGSRLGSCDGKGCGPLRVSMAAATGLRAKMRVDESRSLTLDSIRDSLVRQEDSIIFSLLERSQYRYNPDTYDPNTFPLDGFHGSLVEFMLKETEKLYAQVGRYKSPDEHPFFPSDLPDPFLPPLQYPQVLHPIADSININCKIWDMYFEDLLPRLVTDGDDGNCGSAAVCDTICLQALSIIEIARRFDQRTTHEERRMTLETLPEVKKSDLAQNQLIGEIPRLIYWNEVLQYLAFRGNSMTGTLSPDMCQLTGL